MLDLGNGDDKSLTADIRLLDGASHIKARYIALSHRWSLQPHIELTQETYSALLKNIPYASLPLLFQDAVKVCRQVGVRYLWIDALCIIQHDEQDWRTESACMGQIYKNADCVTLAHFARGDDEGFLEEAFCDRERIRIGSSKPEIILEISVPPVTTAKETIDESPLSRRGWVFQERLLATRAIHFAKILHSSRGDQYFLSGLWSQGICEQLLWI